MFEARNNIPNDGYQEGENANYYQNNEGQELIQSQEQYTGQRAGSNFVEGSIIMEEAASNEEDQLIEHSHHYSGEHQQFN